MSSYIKKVTNPKTGKKQKAYFIDDYYDSHEYGVGFHKDGSDANWQDCVLQECDFYKLEDIK